MAERPGAGVPGWAEYHAEADNEPPMRASGANTAIIARGELAKFMAELASRFTPEAAYAALGALHAEHQILAGDDGRAQCPVCHRRIMLKVNGRFRAHDNQDWVNGNRACAGENRTPEEAALLMVGQAKERLPGRLDIHIHLGDPAQPGRVTGITTGRE